ncbi:HAD family phosphatase [Aquibium carbonis]|uniref:HAD family phosphatase n=1 Tax=Aquibium carbonis TaxID=2495581 RepID=A0A3S0A9P0_9HYPH|nr:HAD family phosphatase [Aquibium carbonis]RST86788.1 HAD family phosphatase [Aquibium carbonis]
MRPALVIFDCDGILVDTETLSNRRLAEWLCAAGYDTTYEHCRRQFVGRSMSAVKAEVEAAGVSLGADFVDRWNDGLAALFADHVQAVPHVRGQIEAIRASGLPYCVASSARVTKMHLTLGATGLLPFFEDVLFSASMVERGKPFPDLFLHAASTMGFSPADCVVIEDSVPGTSAGIAAGMRVLSYCGDPHGDRDGLAAAGGELFDDMRELAGMIGLDQTGPFADALDRA